MADRTSQSSINDMKTDEEIFIANCFINKLAKQNKDAFLKQVNHIRFIRVRSLKAFSVLPSTEEDWVAIKQFYAIVNKGAFGLTASFPYERPSSKIFGVYIPQNLYDWFSNNSLHTIQKQITLYNATAYFADYGNNIPTDLSKPIMNEINPKTAVNLK